MGTPLVFDWLPGGPQRTETALRERLPQRNDAVTAMILVQFCKLADVVQALPPVAGCLKMVVVNVAANQMSGLSAVCEVPNYVTIFYPKQLFVVRINKADSLLRVIQVPVKPVLAIAVAVQIVIAFFRIEAENVSVFLRIGSESQLPAVETWSLAVRVLIAVRCERCSVAKDCLVLGP